MEQVLQPGLIKGPWTRREDRIVWRCIDEGITKWAEVAKRVPGRLGKQCRERWFNHLAPCVNKSDWTPEEDEILARAHKQLGACACWVRSVCHTAYPSCCGGGGGDGDDAGNWWVELARRLPGRSENGVKNRWNSVQRSRMNAERRASRKAKRSRARVQNHTRFEPPVGTGAGAGAGAVADPATGAAPSPPQPPQSHEPPAASAGDADRQLAAGTGARVQQPPPAHEPRAASAGDADRQLAGGTGARLQQPPPAHEAPAASGGDAGRQVDGGAGPRPTKRARKASARARMAGVSPWGT